MAGLLQGSGEFLVFRRRSTSVSLKVKRKRPSRSVLERSSSCRSANWLRYPMSPAAISSGGDRRAGDRFAVRIDDATTHGLRFADSGVLAAVGEEA